jgi:anti-sigma factor RsiW
MRLLVQADADGELRPAEAARVATHLAHCPDCRAIQDRLLDLSVRIRAEAPRHHAPAGLRQAVHAAVGSHKATPVVPMRRRLVPSAFFGAGFALAACLALVMVLPRGEDPAGNVLPGAVVSAHIHALQPGHLMDVVSTDQHTVKPWFDGRLPFAPPVKELATEGFPLAGGRLEYVAGRTAAALVYRHRQHVIDLFAWPDAEAPAADSGSRDGYNYRRWSQDGMTFWAVSDVAPEDLAAFVRDWQAA